MSADEFAIQLQVAPQKSFDPCLAAAPLAKARQKAIRAADQAKKFYAAFSSTLVSKEVHFGKGDNRSNPVIVTS